MTDRARWIKDLLWAFAFFGALAIGFRLFYGLGASTNLTDALPWGLWKILNMVAGVALSTGGFTLAFLVYVLRLERFRPLVKPAILIAFLGYGSSCFALFLDIGLPHRIWHPILMWNFHSFLFEVAWCVMVYFSITAVELSPVVLERFGFKRAVHWLHKLTPLVVTVGITLSTLHHTSLGSLFLVTPARLHPLWYTPLLPVHFILSAMGAGLMVVVLAKLLYARLYDPEPVFGPRDCCPGQETRVDSTTAVPRDLPMLRGLATIAVGVLTVYFVVKIADLFWTGAWSALLAGTWESWFYTLELVVGVVVPVTMIALPRLRRSPAAIGTAAGCAALGLAWNRLDVGVFGYFRDAGMAYWPSMAEWGLSLGIVAASGLVFFLAVENLAVFDEDWQSRREHLRSFSPAFDHFSQVWSFSLASGVNRVSLIAVLVVPLAWVTLRPAALAASQPRSMEVQPPRALDLKRARLRIDGDRARYFSAFPHADHQRRLGGEQSCQHCHHLSLPQDHATPCSRCHRATEARTQIFDHTRHLAAVAKRDGLAGPVPGNHSCVVCHGNDPAKGTASAKPCLECHRENMKPTREDRAGGLKMTWATGYREAMHGTCVACHKKEAARLKRPALAECGNCHEALRARGWSREARSKDEPAPTAARTET